MWLILRNKSPTNDSIHNATDSMFFSSILAEQTPTQKKNKKQIDFVLKFTKWLDLNISLIEENLKIMKINFLGNFFSLQISFFRKFFLLTNQFFYLCHVHPYQRVDRHDNVRTSESHCQQIILEDVCFFCPLVPWWLKQSRDWWWW